MHSMRLGLAVVASIAVMSTAGIVAAEADDVPSAPAGMTAGFVLFDRTTDAATAQRNAHKQFRSASLVKILLALDHLASLGPDAAIPSDDLPLLESMLRSSNDDAANVLWARNGGTQIVERMIALLGLTESAPPPPAYPGFWGYTAVTASDVVKIYRYVLEQADPRSRDFIVGNLHRSTQCADDGRDQYFGIPRAVPAPWGVKQGWSGFGDPAPDERCAPTQVSTLALGPVPAGIGQDAPSPSPSAHTKTGVIDLKQHAMHTSAVFGPGDRTILVVLTLAGQDTWPNAAARVTALTKAVYAVR